MLVLFKEMHYLQHAMRLQGSQQCCCVNSEVGCDVVVVVIAWFGSIRICETRFVWAEDMYSERLML